MSTVMNAPSTRPEAAGEPTAKAADTAKLLGHEYDGIREYDNPMPTWWVNVFWASCLFSLVYFLHYVIFQKGESIHQSYTAELRDAREREARLAMGDRVTEDGLAKLMSNTGMLEDAKQTFVQRCSPCHAEHGEGKIGPNLTDDAWLHGKGTLMDIHEVVSNGVPAKGMPAWSRQLTPIELNKVVAFIGSIRGRHVPGKAPEGVSIAAN